MAAIASGEHRGGNRVHSVLKRSKGTKCSDGDRDQKASSRVEAHLGGIGGIGDMNQRLSRMNRARDAW